MPLIFLGFSDGHDLYLDTRTGNIVIEGPEEREEITRRMIKRFIEDHGKRDDK